VEADTNYMMIGEVLRYGRRRKILVHFQKKTGKPLIVEAHSHKNPLLEATNVFSGVCIWLTVLVYPH
jgi:hypothetical protein